MHEADGGLGDKETAQGQEIYFAVFSLFAGNKMVLDLQ